VFTATVAQRCRVYEDVDARQPGPGEVRVRNRAIGLNFVDIYLRTGASEPPRMPFTLGKEGSGEVLALGRGRHWFR